MVVVKHTQRRRDGRTSFKQCVEYVEAAKEKDGEKCLYAGSKNFQIGENETQNQRIKTMIATAAANPLCKDPIYHDVISWKADEIPTKEQAEEALNIYLKEMGFEGCQVVYALHQNTKFIHLHVCVNKVHPDTLKAITPHYRVKAEQRVARIIEFEQGWEINNTGKFYKIIDGQVVELDGKNHTIRAIKQAARDFERRTGEKSVIRIAQNQAGKILWQASKGEIKDWQDVHKKLAEIGFEIQKAGRGGVLVYHQDGEEIGIKLSSISQKLSLGKLEKQLGEFAENQKTEVKEQTARPLIDNNKGLKEYIEEKKKFYAQRSIVISQSKNFYKEKNAAYKELSKKQKEERSLLYQKGNWKGRGRELNIRRSLLAAEQLNARQKFKLEWQEKQLLKKEIVKEAKQARFPDYVKWQEERNNPDAAWRFIYAQTLYGRIMDDNQENEHQKVRQETKPFLNEYSTDWNTKKGLLNFYKNEKLAFYDNGYRITVLLQSDENIKDALLLAKEKWGGVTLYGTDEFKKRALEIALQNNIEVKNPELQGLIEMKKEELKQAEAAAMKTARTAPKEVKEHIAVFNDYCDLLATSQFRITCSKPVENSKPKTFLLKNDNDQINMKPVEIQAQWKKIEELNAAGWNIYVTPVPEAMNKELYILVDDLSEQSLAQMKDDGYKPTAVFETSPGNYQAMIIVEKNFIETDEKSKMINKNAANKLMQELNEVYGDKNIRAAIHPHRIPGMNNNKLKRIAENGGKPPVVKLVEFNRDQNRVEKDKDRTQAEQLEHKIGHGAHCQLAQLRLNEHIKEIRRITLQKEKERAAELKRAAALGQTDTIDPTTAFIIHAKDIIDHYGVGDWSRLDAEVATRMKATGYSTIDIQEAVQHGSPAVRPENKRNKQWDIYAKRTAEYTESFACRQKIRQQEHRINAWRALEGRTKNKTAELERD